MFHFNIFFSTILFCKNDKENLNKNNKEAFIDCIMQVNILYKQSLNTENLDKIYNSIQNIGLNYVYFEEFLAANAWYFYNLNKNGNPVNFLDSIKCLKDVIKFYPSNLYLFFLITNFYEYLLKNEFYDYSVDFIEIIGFMSMVIRDLCQDFSPEELKRLEDYQKQLKEEKYKYLANNLLKNFENQFLLCLYKSYENINGKDKDEILEPFSLIILIHHFFLIDFPFLQNKYKTKLQTLYPKIFDLVKHFSFMQ